MRCPEGHDNRDDAAFCLECGARLTRACPACGRELPPGARFCDGCGTRVDEGAPARAPQPAYAPPPHLAEKIRRERASIEGERRNVTALFVDAVGSTSAGEKTDAESYHRIVQACTERMIDAVNRYEGTVTQFRGDGIMAVFGAPIAHEDSARRAVAAAVVMRESLREYARELESQGGRPMAYRIGLNTGPVIVGSIGSDLTMDYTAIGDTVNLAARMEQWAPPWSIYITEHTRRLVGPYFELRDLGSLEIKGKAEGVRAYDVMRELPQRTRLDASADRGLTAYVGRDDEVSLLRAYFETAKRGEGQVVFISGEPGMGKSRLLLEFRRTLGETPWFEGRCISWGRNFPYLPIVDVVRRAFSIEEGDSDEAITQSMEEGTAHWDDPACEAASPFLRYLLNVDPGDAARAMDPSERRMRTLDALRTLLRQQSRLQPIVVVIEDLHWVDEQSEEALLAMVDAAASLPVLLVITYRPGYVHSFGDRSYYARVALRNLPADASRFMVEEVLQADGIPAELEEMIVDKAEGNPFFIEEVSRALTESGVLRRAGTTYRLARPLSEVTIPDTIQEVILSRIDRLESRAREAVQYASVIGREFPVRLLKYVASAEESLDGLLLELKALELIYEKSYFPELEYMFKHALTHEVALSTLLADRRRALHRIVAAAIEDLYAERLPEQYEALAYHYYQGEEWEKACEYSKLVAERAEKLYAPRAVIEHLTRAIEAGLRCAEEGCDCPTGSEHYRTRGRAYEATGDFDRALADYEAAIEGARAAGSIADEWQARVDLGMLWAGRDYGQTGDHFQQAYEIAKVAGDDRMMAHTLNRIGNWRCNNTDQPDEGVREHEEALAIFRRLNDKRGTAESLDYLAMACALSGDLTTAAGYGREGIELYRQLEERQGLAGLLTTMAFSYISGSSEMLTLATSDLDPAEFAGLSDEALRTAEEISWLPGQAFARCNRCLGTLALGRYGQSLAEGRAALEIAERIGHTQWQTFAHYGLGSAHADLFARAMAYQHFDRACELAASTASLHWIRTTAADYVRCLIQFGDVERAEELLSRHHEPPMPMISMGQRGLWLARAELLRAQGDSHDAALEIIDRLGATGPNTGDRGVQAIPYLALVRARVLMDLGRLDEAEADLRAALEGVRRSNARPLEWQILAASADRRLASGRDDEARSLYALAFGITQQLSLTIDDPGLRHMYLISDPIERLRREARTAAF